MLLVAVVAAAWGGCAVWRSLAPDDSKIRWALEEAVQDFNDGRPGYSVAPLAEEWYDATSGVHRDTLHRALIGMKWQERDGDWRLVMPAESLMIDVGDGAATTTFELQLGRERESEVEVQWRFAIDADWSDTKDGWKIVRSSHRTLEGRRP